MCANMCANLCANMCANMCAHMCATMCATMCANMSAHMCARWQVVRRRTECLFRGEREARTLATAHTAERTLYSASVLEPSGRALAAEDVRDVGLREDNIGTHQQ